MNPIFGYPTPQNADAIRLRIGRGLFGYPPVSPLDIKAAVGTSTSPTVTGTKAVTGVGFTPKGLLNFGAQFTTDSASTHGLLVFGGGSGTSATACVAVSSNTGVTTTLTNRRHAATLWSNLGTLGGTNSVATLSSLDASGFTRNYTSANGTADILNHICLGGADLEVSLTQQQMNGTNAAQSFAHGLSGAPTGVLFFSAINATAPANTTTALSISIGAWAGASQWGGFAYSENGTTTTNTARILLTSAVASFFGFAKTLQRSMAVSSVDATNVNVTYPTSVSSGQMYFWMLAIRGAKCQVGTFNANGSTSAINISTTGITPKLFLPVFIPSGVSSAGSVLNDLLLTIGASDGTNNVSCGISDENAVTTTNARRVQSSTTLCEYSKAGVKSFEATAAFSGQSVIVTPTTAAATFGQAGYLCIGS